MEDHETMREIASKHFNDNFVITIFQGFIVDILEYWGAFKAARTSINTLITVEKVKELAEKHRDNVKKLNERLLSQVKEFNKEDRS